MKNIQPRRLECRRAEQVDHLGRVDRAADDLSYRRIQVAPVHAFAVSVSSEPALEHGGQPVEE